jgi:hypothetical protein
MKKALIAAVAVAFCTASALADLTGTELDVQLTQSGLLGGVLGPTGGTHTYGESDMYFPALSPETTWTLSSPAAHPDYDNAMLLDFTLFDYALYSVPDPSVSTFEVTNLAEDVAAGSPAVFLPTDPFTDIALDVTTSDHAFSVQWSVDDVVLGDPQAPMAIVAWNSVPAPGALAVLGLGALRPRRRRRRA